MNRSPAAGFTLIELLAVMAIIAVLLTLAVPRYFSSVERSKEAVLRQDLATVRDSLDKYFADTGRYPDDEKPLLPSPKPHNASFAAPPDWAKNNPSEKGRCETRGAPPHPQTGGGQ